LVIADNISIMISLYALVLFYEATKQYMQEYRPLSKFLSVKAVVFFIFWQQIAISVLSYYKIIVATPQWSIDDIGYALQNFVVTIEMYVLSLAFAYAFCLKSYKESGIRNVISEFSGMVDVRENIKSITSNVKPLFRNFAAVADMRDVVHDTYQSFGKAPKRHINVADFLELTTEQQNERIIKHGWLEKLGEDILSTFKKRYFLLLSRPKGLLYFDHNPIGLNTPMNPNGFVDFATVSNVVVNQKDPTILEVLTPSRVWTMRCSNVNECEEWMEIVKKVLRDDNPKAEPFEIEADSFRSTRIK